ncbi:MAG: acyltransferase, partial [Chloroflexi bacterium]|nr:acyltransferase [Chloroflexota bacterium]
MRAIFYSTNTSPAIKSQRLYYIDWLRLMAVFLLFFFHTARIFDPWENFYVQNDPLSSNITYIFVWAIGPWQMKLFFLLAGASTYYALRKRSGGEYARERFKRLFIPFVFGVLVLIPPQSYLGLLNHSDYANSFFSWYPDFFHLQTDDMDGYFLGGHTWGHLWFILHLLVYSLIALPLFLYFNREKGQRWVSRIANAFTKPGVLFLFPLLLVLFNELPDVAGGNPLSYITFFIAGFILMSNARLMDTIDRYRIILLLLGVVPFAGILATTATHSWPSGMPEWVDYVTDGYIDGFVPWYVILAMLAYGRRLLNFTNRFLKYFAEGAYALYILHQAVIVITGFFVVQWGLAV